MARSVRKYLHLRMRVCYTIIQTNIVVGAKMEEILKMLDLSAHSVRYVEENISQDIVCKLSIDFHNLGINDRNTIMSLRIACSKFGSYTPERSYHTNKFVITKIFLENLIQEGFTVKEISAVASVSERTIYRRMTEYDLKIRDFSKVSDNQRDLEVLALTNHYPFCGEIMLRELLKGRGFNVERYRPRDSIHRINDFDGIDYENNTEFTVFTENNTVSKESLVAESESNEVAPRCSLKYSDLKEISDNRMLNDNIINTVQKTLKKQFSQANGLQDPVLGRTLKFNVNKNLPFVQVMHDGRIHWIALSTFNCNEGEINLMDSLFKGRVPDHSKQQLSSLLNCRNKNIKINVLPVQQQTNGVDCGLFALEFCSEILLMDFNQIGIYFQEDKLRPHLLHCLAAGKITEFPKSTKESYKLCGEKLFHIDIFYSCRIP